ncbi:MAG: hypothetical protein MSS83_06805, partial [Methanobrevibacter sp.]|uniref:hypothetical protein n=1 Tax=Methanobrevibacter sp. TaxID=66852 RepID=UPI0031F4F3B8|nr:hypothetical protein [Methanobrevibacter sp.]
KQRQKKLSCLAMLEFVSTIYALKTIATKTVISKHRKALRSLFTKRMLPENQTAFSLIFIFLRIGTAGYWRPSNNSTYSRVHCF